MSGIEIKNFPDLLKGYIDSAKKVKKFNLIKLPQAGYGSIMAKAEITLEDKNGSEEVLHTVVKLLPVQEFVKKIFQIETTYKNEVQFYKTILPTIKHFQEEHGVQQVDSFARFYGARLSLDKDEVDDDAALILEDLTIAGFKNINRREGFDLDGAKVILRDLARFQGTVIALKFVNPKLFEENVKSFCKDFIHSKTSTLLQAFKTSLKNNEKWAPFAKKIGPWPCDLPKPREPYATIAHCDLWVNNTMQKIEEGKIIANVFVDFQVFSYKSCASDVFFFLWTSCQTEVIRNHLDELLKHYHDNLIQALLEFNCDTTQFGFEKFLEELKIVSTFEFGHALFFVFIAKHDSPISEGNLKNKTTEEEYMGNMPQKVKEHVYLMLEECDRRGWLH